MRDDVTAKTPDPPSSTASQGLRMRWTDSLTKPNANSLAVIEKVSDGLPEGQPPSFRPRRGKTPGSGGRVLHFRFGPLQGMRRVRHRLRGSPGAEDGAGD